MWFCLLLLFLLLLLYCWAYMHNENTGSCFFRLLNISFVRCIATKDTWRRIAIGIHTIAYSISCYTILYSGSFALKFFSYFSYFNFVFFLCISLYTGVDWIDWYTVEIHINKMDWWGMEFAGIYHSMDGEWNWYTNGNTSIHWKWEMLLPSFVILIFFTSFFTINHWRGLFSFFSFFFLNICEH